MITDLTLLIISFAILYFGASWLVRGAAKIADCLNISRVVAGVILVAFGTSAPELFVNIIASVKGHTGIAMTNIAGSNLANICIGYGICAFAGVLIIDKKSFRWDLFYLCISPAVILTVLLFRGSASIPFWSAFLLMALFVGYIHSAKSRLFAQSEDEFIPPQTGLAGGIALFLAGVIALYLSGEVVVQNAVSISYRLGVSQAVTGLTVVAVGTSIPDIMASISAIKQKENSIAVGNILGSNIFNILLVLSCSMFASRASLESGSAVMIDYIAVLIFSLAVAAIAIIGKKMNHILAAAFIIFYLLYLTSRVAIAA